MKYFLAIILPPLAILLCGKPGQFILNVILTFIGWVPGVIHALIVVSSSEADRRNKMLIEAVKATKQLPTTES